MAYGFSGNVEEFLSVVQAGELGRNLSSGREASGGHPLSPIEEEVWNRDGSAVAGILSRSDVPSRSTYLMLTEYDIPGRLGRCDLVLLGGDARGRKHAAIFELKRWQRFEPHEIPIYVYAANGIHLHPSEQALQYRDRLEMFHARAADYDLHAGAWMTCMARTEADRLGRTAPQDAPVWCLPDPSPAHVGALTEWFRGGIAPSEVAVFRDARCVQRAELAEKMFARLPYLTRGVSKALGGLPLDLSDRQEEIVTAISAAIRDPGHALIVVSGAPGCGKTVAGIHALVHALLETNSSGHDGRKPAVLALRNNRLCTVVRAAIDESLGKRVGRALVQYVKGGGPGVGLQPEVERLLQERPSALPCYELVVVDEAHRVPHGRRSYPEGRTQLESVLSAGRVVACLLDDRQRLNEDDNGDLETVTSTWRSLFPGAPVVHLDMGDQHRVPAAYADWLEALLRGELRKMPAGYEFRVVSTEREVVDYLRSHAADGDCGLLASYTVCNGRRGKTLRVPGLGIHWLMDPKEYDAWWRRRDIRHRFDRCSSVYGCQGFELDYAGLFWGRDLALGRRGTKIELELSRPHDIKDDIHLAHGKKLRALADEAVHSGDGELTRQVVARLGNRYRILLSRARRGIAVYCEDQATAVVLRDCLT
jgi:DUF2075 family protein